MLDLSPLRDAVNSLADGLEVVSDREWFDRQSRKVQNTLIAGVIQNFEFVYELCFKMMRRQIEADADHPHEIDQFNFRDVLRVAAEKGFITNVESWFHYRQMRNLTSHTYDHSKAQQIYEQTWLFIQDARALLEQLEARNA